MASTDMSKVQAIRDYVIDIAKRYATGDVTEHSYRGSLQTLLEKFLPNFTVINEPKRRDCGVPDYIIIKNQIPIAFVEAKDIGDGDLDGKRDKGHKEQFDRYKNALDHILFTDYLDFHLYEKGNFIDSVQIAEIRGEKIVLLKENAQKFFEIINHLANAKPQKITSPDKLAKIMAAKTKLLMGAVEKSLSEDVQKSGKLSNKLSFFKKYFIHNLTKKSFADIYAQTICYGMFAARLHDSTPETFSRIEAAELIPATNPFLRKIFQDIAGYSPEENIKWIIDDLASAYRVTDMHEIMAKLRKREGFEDPLIYFYEDFLKIYDPDEKAKSGVFYTPQPVVKFIVNAVDAILKKTFNLTNGLADTSKVKVKQSNNQRIDNRTSNHKQIVENEYHRVQVLDPATGTGTFLVETIRKVYQNLKGNLGTWENYVEKELLPRINGFELMMAPYAIAHIKLGLVLSELGYIQKNDKHLPIFLTNSLEKSDTDSLSLWAHELAEEAEYANCIKQTKPVMIMMGNPPYNVSSNNKSDWILSLLVDYKRNLKEKKLNLDDDYIKFIRLGQYYIEKNQEGIVAFITNNSYIGGITHYQMRKSLMNTFDEIYILNLHGYIYEEVNSSTIDENVFDITQGVSINIFVKHKNAKSATDKVLKKTQSSAKIYYYDLLGTRNEKYIFLQKNSLTEIPWQELTPQAPQYFFVPKDYSILGPYKKGFKIDELMKVHNVGIGTDRDSLFYDVTKDSLEKRMKALLSGKDLEHSFIEKYNVKDSSSYEITKKIKNVQYKAEAIQKAQRYVFDYEYLYYDRNLISRPAFKVMQHMQGENIALVVPRQCSSNWRHSFCTNVISDHNLIASAGRLGAGDLFPLYLYPSEKESAFENSKIPNLDKPIWEKINKCVGSKTSPEQIFDYIYGILHSPSYRKKYNEFLKVDFPRIPYPKNKEEFDKITTAGNKLRKLHLTEEISHPLTATFNIPGDGAVTKIRFELEKNKTIQSPNNIEGKVFINEIQCFENIPEIAWNLYIGSYQPAQKWLKERKGQFLSYDDIEHYRKIIAILMETHKLMNELG